MPDQGEMMVNPDVLSAVGTIQQVRTQHATAMSVQKPRTLSGVEKRFLEEAAMAGETFFYGWGAGKDRIEGGSIDLAMALVRTWGNCAVEMLPVQDLPDAWVFTAAFVDLETGFTISRQFRQSKLWIVHGKHDAARKEDIRFQIGQSKSIRNVVLSALPKWLANKGVEAAKSNVRGRIEKAIENKGAEYITGAAIKRMAGHGVTEPQVLAKFGRSTTAALTIEDLVVIHSDIHAIENGLDTVESLYDRAAAAPTGPAANGPEGEVDKLKAKLKASTAPVVIDAAEPAVVPEPEAMESLPRSPLDKLDSETVPQWLDRLAGAVPRIPTGEEIDAILKLVDDTPGAGGTKERAALIRACNRRRDDLEFGAPTGPAE